MSDTKLSFTAFLEYAASEVMFSPTQLGNTQLSQDNYDDPNEDDGMEDPKKFQRLKKAISKRKTQDYPAEDSDSKLFAMLKDFLDDEDNGTDEPPAYDHPAEVDHDELEDIDAGDGEESELDPDNIGPFEPHNDVNDQPHPGETADAEFEDEKHSQLMQAINDLRQDLKTQHSQQPKKNGIKITRMESPPEEQEEENEESYEEDDQEDTKQASARQLFTGLVNQGKSRQEIIDQFKRQIGVTDSTATSYYQRLAKEAGLTTSGDRELGPQNPTGLGAAAPMEPQTLPGQGGQQSAMQQQPETNVTGVEVEGDPNRQGLVRTVKGAHLVFKRKNEEGTFDELWVFGTGGDMKNSLEVRRAILAGTDIPPRAIKSQDGSQSYTLTSLGNGQLLNIKGLPN
jgi:hypothetical protein